MTRKFVYLFLALLLPGLIFVFLKQFGKNEFSIPVYHGQSADSLNAVCGTHYATPYVLPDTVLEKAGWEGRPATLFIVQNGMIDNKEFKRALEGFDREEVQIVELNENELGATVFKRWSSCVLVVPAPRSVVLVDREKRIRGYYAPATREEADRLAMEMEILLKKY